MALTGQQTNFINDLQTISERLLDDRQTIERLMVRWNQNDMFNQLVDADVTAHLSHLTKSEVANAVNAITAVYNALGDFETGQAVNLVKMKG